MGERHQGVGVTVLEVHEYKFELSQYLNVQVIVAVNEDLHRGQVNDWQKSGEAREERLGGGQDQNQKPTLS